MPQGSSHQEQLRRQLATLPCRPAGSLGVWAPAVWCTMLGWAGWWPRQCCLAASMACQPSCCAGGSLGPPKRAASGNASPALLSAAGCTARCMQMCHLIAGPSMQLAVLRPAETRKGVKGMLQVLACSKVGNLCADTRPFITFMSLVPGAAGEAEILQGIHQGRILGCPLAAAPPAKRQACTH